MATFFNTGIPGAVDTSSPEAQYASLLRNWLTNYGQEYSKAIEYVSVAYARGYLQSWPEDGYGGITSADLSPIIDLLNEFISETADDDKTLINKFRNDM
jgi:hypothetical protein